MQKHRSITVERLEKFIQTGQFSDVNLRSALWKKKTTQNIALTVYSVPDLKRIPFSEAIKGEFRPAKVGDSFGPGWATHWFKVTLTVPADYAGEQVIFNFDPDCEGMIWSLDGVPQQGITPGNHIDYRLTKAAKPNEHFSFYIEIACNGMFGNGDGGFIEPPDPNREFTLKKAELAVPNLEAWALLWDVEILLGLVKDMPSSAQISADALYTANQIANTFRWNQPESVAQARKISTSFFAKRVRQGHPDHEITAIGNCHIDTAWLWPYDETKRKAGRSFSTQISFMEDYPHYKFAASQAQQFEWVEQLYPELFQKMQAKAKSGQFIPIGGTVQNNKDKEYTNQSLLLFGNGDGGGGPLVEMLERLDRLQKIDSLPATVTFGSPNDFFEKLDATSKDLVTWKGELYFELHRGTYTTHGLIKKYNRKMEYLLRDCELYAVLAAILTEEGEYSNPKTELDRLWKLVLLNQFHDVLPGSSIEMVYQDATRFYEDVDLSGNRLRMDALRKIWTFFSAKEGAQAILVLNPTGWKRQAEVIEFDLADLESGVELLGGSTWQQLSKDGKALVYMAQTSSDTMVMENRYIKVTIRGGRIVSYFDKEVKREIIAAGESGNVFKMFEDVPLFWDAWDVEVYHLEKGWECPEAEMVIEETGPIRAVVLAKVALSSTSTLEQRIIITAADKKVEFDTKINWNENRVILKVEFPLNINYDYATYETQFGYIQRPTHYNNSWDLARFEVCGHKYADLSEYGYGVALLNDCKFGYSVKENVMRMSLLRAPKVCYEWLVNNALKAPDSHCDIGTHRIRYALYPHQGHFLESDVVRKAYEFNVPPAALRILAKPEDANRMTVFPTFSVDSDNIVMDTVKHAEDPRPRSNGVDAVIRLYEAKGGRGMFKFSRFSVATSIY
ncbi:Glycoside hydrolase, 38 vacuolar alpha mannosidase [Phlyctochytrium bullatum]|nr:Glycoside hydrolase, 38 vacuolar alpha mannosidase [Phlyctochytrium bullatum]